MATSDSECEWSKTRARPVQAPTMRPPTTPTVAGSPQLRTSKAIVTVQTDVASIVCPLITLNSISGKETPQPAYRILVAPTRAMPALNTKPQRNPRLNLDIPLHPAQPTPPRLAPPAPPMFLT